METNPQELPKQETNIERESKKNKRFLILAGIGMLIILTVLSSSIFLYRRLENVKIGPQNDVVLPPVTTISHRLTKPLIIPTTQPFTCNLSNPEYCQTIERIKQLVDSNQIDQLVPLLQMSTITCEYPSYPPDYIPITACNGMTNGEEVDAITIAYNVSEGNYYTSSQFIQTLGNYMQKNGPFSFKRFTYDENMPAPGGALNYLSTDGKSMLSIDLRTVNNKIVIDGVMLGISNEYFDSLSGQ